LGEGKASEMGAMPDVGGVGAGLVAVDNDGTFKVKETMAITMMPI